MQHFSTTLRVIKIARITIATTNKRQKNVALIIIQVGQSYSVKAETRRQRTTLFDLTSAENVSIRLPTFFIVLCMCKWSRVWLHGSSYVDLSVISCSMGQKLEGVCYTSLQETVIKHLCYIRQLYINCKYVAVNKITCGLLSLGSNNLQYLINYSCLFLYIYLHGSAMISLMTIQKSNFI